jgi:hypothetical protein
MISCIIIHLSNVELEDLSEITRLGENQQVKRPGATEIGHDDGVDGHRSEKASPRSRVEIGNGSLDVRQRFFDVKSLAGRDGRVETRFFERQPHPKDVPDDTKHTCRHFRVQLNSFELDCLIAALP